MQDRHPPLVPRGAIRVAYLALTPWLLTGCELPSGTEDAPAAEKSTDGPAPSFSTMTASAAFIILNAANDFTDEIALDVRIAASRFETGSGPLFGTNLEFSCGYCSVATFEDARSMLGHFGQGLTCSSIFRPHEFVELDVKLCVRSTVNADKYDFDLLSFSSRTNGCVENPVGSCAAADGHTSYLRTLFEPIVVTIDLKPENARAAPNVFNIAASAPVKVAVVSTPDFDATTLDLSTVELGDARLAARIVAQASTPQDVDRDGRLDIIFDFGPVSDFTDTGALDGNSVEVELTGAAGIVGVVGTDAIEVVGNAGS